jgi:hypothetical protein
VSAGQAFVLSFGVTLLLLGGVVATGLRARRRLHLPLVAASVAALVVTIVCAKRLGEHFDLQSAGWITPFHLGLAKLATASYLLPLVTGILTLRNPRWRPRHRICACVTLALTVAAAVTGIWMIWLAEPLVV